MRTPGPPQCRFGTIRILLCCGQGRRAWNTFLCCVRLPGSQTRTRSNLMSTEFASELQDVESASAGKPSRVFGSLPSRGKRADCDFGRAMHNYGDLLTQSHRDEMAQSSPREQEEPELVIVLDFVSGMEALRWCSSSQRTILKNPLVRLTDHTRSSPLCRDIPLMK